METDAIKVLHIDDAHGWRGGQQQAFYLIAEMHRQGFTTAIICQPNSSMAEKCREASIPFHCIRMHNELDIFAAIKIARHCKTHGYSIIHAHSAHALSLGIFAKLLHRQLKLIASRRVDFSVRKSAFSVRKYSNRFVDKIICISEKIKKVLLEDGLPEEKLIKIYSGVELNKYRRVKSDTNFRGRWNIPENHFLVGTVAALVGHKDYPTLLNAAKYVIEENNKVTFLAVGSGKDEAKIRQLAEELNLEKRFIFTGYQAEVGNFLCEFDLFVAASRKEGLGTSVLDALALGIPIVGTQAGGIPESVQDGVNGLLVPKQNSKALAEAILTLAEQPELRSKFAENAPHSVEKFSIKNTVEQTLQLYAQFL